MTIKTALFFTLINLLLAIIFCIIESNSFAGLPNTLVGIYFFVIYYWLKRSSKKGRLTNGTNSENCYR